MSWPKPKYECNFVCSNCGKKTTCRIPKGKRIVEWVKEEKALCEYCGCPIKEIKGGENE